jgi:hypothetical protein
MSRKRTCYVASLVILSLTLSGCGVIVRQAHDAYQKIEAGSLRYQGRIAPLTAKELLWAKTAWRYFVNNTNSNTGLVNSIDRYPVASVWHMGDYLAALMSAHQLGLIDKIEFDQRLSRFLEFVQNMPLAQGKLPNRMYNTKTGQMMDASNRVGEVGWSAIDISRLMVWLKITGEHYPEYREYLDKVILRWHYCDIIDDCGQLYRYNKNGQTWDKQQEGRLGYEEYAGTGFSLWGFNANSARRMKLDQRITIDNLQLLYDERDPRLTNTPNPILTMPYVLLGFKAASRYGVSRARTAMA